MAKRFTDTHIWKNQRWFRKLSPTHKLVFFYIKDQCSHAGIWKIDCSDILDDLGIEDFDLSVFIESVNTEFDKISGKKIKKERLKLLENNNLWITGFIQFQYQGKDLKVSEDVPGVRSAIEELSGFGILDIALENSYITLRKGLRNPKDKEKDKDLDKDNMQLGGVGELTPVIQKIFDNGTWESEKRLFLNAEEWQMKQCSFFGISKEVLEAALKRFIEKIENQDDFKSEKELKRHFHNWYPKNKDAPIVKKLTYDEENRKKALDFQARVIR
mgnify:FL=1